MKSEANRAGRFIGGVALGIVVLCSPCLWMFKMLGDALGNDEHPTGAQMFFNLTPAQTMDLGGLKFPAEMVDRDPVASSYVFPSTYELSFRLKVPKSIRRLPDGQTWAALKSPPDGVEAVDCMAANNMLTINMKGSMPLKTKETEVKIDIARVSPFRFAVEVPAPNSTATIDANCAEEGFTAKVHWEDHTLVGAIYFDRARLNIGPSDDVYIGAAGPYGPRYQRADPGKSELPVNTRWVEPGKPFMVSVFHVIQRNRVTLSGTLREVSPFPEDPVAPR